MGFSGVPNGLVDTTIVNNGFLPDLTVADFQQRYQVPAELLQGLVEDQLRAAMADINGQLAAWQAIQQAEGSATLAEVPARAPGGVSVLVTTYERAVYSLTKAWLIAPSAAIGRRDNAEQAVADSQRYYDGLLTDSELAVRTLQGRGRITAVLI